MLISRALEVHGEDTQAAVRGFLGRMLEEGIVDRVFLPVGHGMESEARPHVLRSEDALRTAEPLTPIMLENSADDLRRALQAEPEKRYGALLRPCETRTVVEMAKRGRVDLERVVLIGMDCIGTYPGADNQGGEDYGERQDKLLCESLELARSGVPEPKEGARLTCRLCERPAPDYRAVDVTLGLIGVDNSHLVLVQAEEAVDEQLRLARLADRIASEREAVDREMALWRLSERRKEAADAILGQLGLDDASMSVIAGYFGRCTLCGECLQSCPVCSEELWAALRRGKHAFVTAWICESLRLASCSGCGACEGHCPERIPLSAISRALSRQVQRRMRYMPGRDVTEPLPWLY
jgi:formate dehydrogenase subunit beta